MDISDAIDIAWENFERNGFGVNSKFIQCDLNHIPITKKVDVIFQKVCCIIQIQHKNLFLIYQNS